MLDPMRIAPGFKGVANSPIGGNWMHRTLAEPFWPPPKHSPFLPYPRFEKVKKSIVLFCSCSGEWLETNGV